MGERTSGSNGNEFDESAQLLLKQSQSFNGGQLEDQVALIVSPAEVSTQFTFNYGPRPCRDLAFAIIFLLAVTAVLVFGIFAIVHHNSDYRWAESAQYDNKTCSIFKYHGKRSRPRATFDLIMWKDEESKWARHRGPVVEHEAILHMEEEEGRFFSKLISFELKQDTHAAGHGDVGTVLLTTLAVTVVLCVPLVLGLLWLLKTYMKELVYVSVPLLILVPLALDILWFVVCLKDDKCHRSIDPSSQIGIFLFVIALCGVFAWIIYANWDRVELTIKIIRTASEALRSNLSLLFILPSLTVVLLIFLVPILTFMAYAYMNGRLVPNPALDQQPSLPCGKGYGQDCCIWKTEGWVPAYQVLAAFTLLWSVMVMSQVQSFTISGTISQWYFAQRESPAGGFIKCSLGHAFGSSFGTCCLSGLVFAFVRLIRWAVDSVQNNRMQQGVVIGLLRCCLECVLQGIEFLTKFTLNFASITGEGYCASAVMTYNLLRRNLLSPVVVEIISSRLLSAIVFVVSAVYAVVVFALLHAFANIGTQSYTVSLIAWVLVLFVLVLLIGVLNAVIDTVYICYSMDKDQGTVSKSQVHDVYVLLPLSPNYNASLAIRQPSI
ncbi:hypothetical protein O6H91_13G095500 [Diphasiastrum complanatum]|uniref:Uncharacterized protein n=2 Tax=Diphasiastrum complanatum TaxID=34168 RepID=A0ACC2BXF6_DIPCM|nr:hypothetical protein O6H91_13G095500 [Diphasiastrum complanatum]KAJ7534454.1 hypothetical protein O6H91_13G095500 [Diphasiastrum complanatum]